MPGVLAGDAEVLNDEDRVLAGAGHLDAEHMLAAGGGRAEVNGPGQLDSNLRAIATHRPTSPGAARIELAGLGSERVSQAQRCQPLDAAERPGRLLLPPTGGGHRHLSGPLS